jgi:hypothetical protein
MPATFGIAAIHRYRWHGPLLRQDDKLSKHQDFHIKNMQE